MHTITTTTQQKEDTIMSKNLIYGVFSDPDVTVDAGYKLTGEGVKINTVYSPFPVHGIDPAIGLKPTRISVAAFIFGATGLSLAVLMVWYMNIYDWPMNIGGKPSFSLSENFPSFVPVMFELTILCGAHGMIWTFFFISDILPGKDAKNPDPRTTDDKIIIEIDPSLQKQSEAELIDLLKSVGAEEINRSQNH